MVPSRIPRATASHSSASPTSTESITSAPSTPCCSEAGTVNRCPALNCGLSVPSTTGVDVSSSSSICIPAACRATNLSKTRSRTRSNSCLSSNRLIFRSRERAQASDAASASSKPSPLARFRRGSRRSSPLAVGKLTLLTPRETP